MTDPLKGAKELQALPPAALAALGTAVADAAAHIVAAAGFDRRCAGILALRASMELLLLDAPPATVGAWLERQAADLSRLGGQAGNA